ncbi:hypothetical protein DIPPA_07367 [Diplonema papillatum]|nr:hypothetical protein DIPPA_07367 [Diplonema papillatum]
MRPMQDLRAGPGASNVRWVFNEDDESDDGTQSLSPGSPCSMATTDTTCAVPSPLLSPNLPFRARMITHLWLGNLRSQKSFPQENVHSVSAPAGWHI